MMAKDDVPIDESDDKGTKDLSHVLMSEAFNSRHPDSDAAEVYLPPECSVSFHTCEARFFFSIRPELYMHGSINMTTALYAHARKSW